MNKYKSGICTTSVSEFRVGCLLSCGGSWFWFSQLKNAMYTTTVLRGTLSKVIKESSFSKCWEPLVLNPMHGRPYRQGLIGISLDTPRTFLPLGLCIVSALCLQPLLPSKHPTPLSAHHGAQRPTSKVALSCGLSWCPDPGWLPTAGHIVCYILQSECMCCYCWPLLLTGWNIINVLSRRMWRRGGRGRERSTLTW